MSRILVHAWLVMALIASHLSAGLTTTTPRSADDGEDGSTATPCAGVLEKQEAMEEDLKSLRQAVLSSSSQNPGIVSIHDHLELKNKLAALEAKLGAAETKLEVAESKVKEDETKLEVSGLDKKLLAMQTKLEIAEMKFKAVESMESKLEAAQIKLKHFETLEMKMEAAETKLEAAETKLEAAETTLKYLKAKQEVAESKLETNSKALQATQSLSKRKGASTFVRWGRKTCSNTTQLMYSGVVGGGHNGHYGSAADYLCLTMSPEFDSTLKPPAYSFIYGTEYHYIPNHHDQDVPCSVCRTPHPTTRMIPGTHSCPSGWTVQYTGHLASGYHGHKSASEHVCLDEDMENASKGYLNQDGRHMYYIIYVCGSLPCPPYVANKVALCVVCSL